MSGLILRPACEQDTTRIMETMQPQKARAFCAVCWRRTVAELRA